MNLKDPALHRVATSYRVYATIKTYVDEQYDALNDYALVTGYNKERRL